MGLFTQKPQQIEPWAALPGEPLDPDSPVERLADSGTDATALGSGGLGSGGWGLSRSVTSISIPLSTPDPED